jgi:hypothetical protein
MKLSAKSFAALFVDTRAMIFGVTIFALVLLWMRSPDFDILGNIFGSLLLLTASILILLNKRWSNLVAVILSGYLPVEFLRAFWMFPRLAEVPVLSLEHFRYFFGPARLASVYILLLFASSMMLARSTSAIMRNAK